jgi:hypothetical protein
VNTIFFVICLVCCSLFTSCRKSKGEHSRRCIYDHSTFAKVALSASKDEEQFSKFKRDPFFNLLWENYSFEEGQLWQRKIAEYPFLKEKFELFREVDQIGSPRTFLFGEAGVFSPSTLRLIALTGDLSVKLGKLGEVNIIQIGAGQGSWCKILNDTLSFKSYVLVDLPEQLALAKKCLERLGVKNVQFLTPEELPRRGVYDLVISDMSFSEFNRAHQELFFDRIISRSHFGYILGHEPPRHCGVAYMNFEELKIQFEKIGKYEFQEPLNNRDHYFIYWKK